MTSDTKQAGGTNPWLIAVVVALAAFMEVLDTTIANVALPYVAGGLGVSEDEASWVVTTYLVSNAVALTASSFLAQRLGRRVCRDCREPYEASEESLVPYGHVPQGHGTINFFKGKGCQTCNFTGMKGRVAIYEVMPVTTELRDLILRNATTNEIRDVAASQGMKTLRQNALQKVIDGVTTVEEVLRVTLG